MFPSKCNFFFLHSMVNSELLDAATFADNYLGRVACATSGYISVGGMITLIAEHLGLKFNRGFDQIIEGRSKVDMESLIHKGITRR